MQEIELPKNWVLATNDDLGDFINGFAFKPADRTEHGTPIIRIQNLTDSQRPFNYTTKEVDQKYVVERGDILVSWSATLDTFRWDGPRAYVNQHIFKVVPSNQLNHRFVFFALKETINELTKSEHLHGTTMKHVNRKPFLAHPVGLPPRNEQHRIVEKIETLFARIDKGEEALREVQKLLKRYRQSILKAAVTGELTRDWREANQHKLEPASELLARILETRRENWQGRGKYKEPAAPDAAQYYELPECWALSSTEQLAYVETGATPKKSESGFYSSEGTPWITSTAVNEDPIRTPQAHITERAIRETNAKLFSTGALVVAMYGEGKTRGKVSELGIDSASNQACAALLVQHLPSEVARYLKLFYLYNYEAIRRQSAGGVQPNLNLSLIKATQVPLPPEQEVGEILTRVNVELSTVQELERTCSTELARSTALRQSILRSAFTGKLVPQDRDDEPANELLARIRRGNDQ